MIRSYIFVALMVALSACEQPPAYSPELLQQWNEIKDAGGPTFAGSPAWHAHMEFVEQGLAAVGVVDVSNYPTPHRRWWAPENPMPSQRQLVVDGETLPVASYWAYSGSTSFGGVTAPLVIYDRKLDKAALKDRIVVFQVNRRPDSLAKMFTVGRQYATADFPTGDNSFADDQWYQSNYPTRFGRFDRALRDSGAVGAVIVFELSAARARGLYTFPLLHAEVTGVPGIYVDELTGQAVLAAAEAGREATLTLIAYEEDVEPYFYSAVLPGRDYGTAKDEQILLVTHSEGPNLTQENGTLGILALIRHYARIPQQDRAKSLRVLLDSQHYAPGRHTVNWYDEHPEIMARVVASVGVEQFGQLEYGEDANGYGLTGLSDTWILYTRDDPELIETAIAAIEATDLPRTELRVPEIKGQGMWTGLGDIALKRDLPGYGSLSNMSGYWTTAARIESFDAELANRQLDTFVILIDALMGREY